MCICCLLCADATYRDKKVDETLTSVAQKTGKKKKKKNMKKFVSDATSEYRLALASYNKTTTKNDDAIIDGGIFH